MKTLLMLALCLFGLVAHADSQDLFNLRTNILGLFGGGYSLALDYAIDNQWTIGPELSFVKYNYNENSNYTSNWKTQYHNYGLRANWFRSGTYSSGWYVSPSIDYSAGETNSSTAAGPISARDSVGILQLMAGYGWFLNGFNIMLGAGAYSVFTGKGSYLKSDGTKDNFDSTGLFHPEPTAELNLGWTF